MAAKFENFHIFDKNTRFRPIDHWSLEQANYAHAAIFAGSSWIYYSRIFRVNRNIPQFAIFVAASAFVSRTYARTLFVTIKDEASIINNNHEREHIK